jgi:hypothetical protein
VPLQPTKDEVDEHKRRFAGAPCMFFTVEPMVNAGRPGVKLLDDGWTAVTRNRSLSAQFEHMVGVTEDGVKIFALSPAGLDKPAYGTARPGRPARLAMAEVRPPAQPRHDAVGCARIPIRWCKGRPIAKCRSNPHDSPHFQTVPKVSAKTGSSASMAANRSTSGSSRNSGMVGMSS